MNQLVAVMPPPRAAQPGTRFQWTDIALTLIGADAGQRRFLLDFSTPALRHLHSPTTAIIRGSSLVDIACEAIQRSFAANGDLALLQGIERMKFLGALNRGDIATIVVEQHGSVDPAGGDRGTYRMEMVRASPVDAYPIMTGLFVATHAPLPAHRVAPACAPTAVRASDGDREALQRLKDSAPANEHLQQIRSLRQINWIDNVSVACGEVIEALVELDPALLHRVGKDAYMLSVGNLIQTCYQLPKIYLFSRSSLSQPGLEFYARHIAQGRFLPMLFCGSAAGHLISVRLQISRIKAVCGNLHFTCAARVTDAYGDEMAAMSFSFLIDTSGPEL